MARPREFDFDEALDAAMAAFWDHGYEATSLADLMDATGLQKGSIYKAFGSKHELFLQALERYFDKAYGNMREAIEGPRSPRQGIRKWLELVVSTCNDPKTRRGCFALNAVVELGPHDEDTARRVKGQFSRIEKILANTIQRGQEQGELRNDRPPQELAETLFMLANGMLATSKGVHSKARLHRIAEHALEILL